MKKRNGFTTVELIVSFGLTMVVLGFLFEILLALKDLYMATNNRTELLTKQSVISRKINTEFNRKKITNIVNCGNECLTFSFNDGSSSDLKIDRSRRTFQYGTYRTILVEDSEFGDVDISSETIYDVADNRNNTFIRIKIPIKYPLYKDEDYGINVVYQYDSRVIPLDDFSFTE